MLYKIHCTQAKFHIPTLIKPPRVTTISVWNQTHFIRCKKSSCIQTLGDSAASEACQRIPLQPTAVN